ncbi:hypothetical protein HRM2_39690 [Desulforapulum autotrophicum HRM2]|uniref:Uncharacterized protein n=1 Tax=Desulforapulum autotrophicum (strain ATCC 43914 / DSM 3382 / VKM B-1955 / HRM2) TaxID=177437 RepID=C0QBM5_DESAH|nr:hypothetical protein HRM2_39690 [Desulforapulum autotrophicum HRM2]
MAAVSMDAERAAISLAAAHGRAARMSVGYTCFRSPDLYYFHMNKVNRTGQPFLVLARPG